MICPSRTVVCVLWAVRGKVKEVEEDTKTMWTAEFVLKAGLRRSRSQPVDVINRKPNPMHLGLGPTPHRWYLALEQTIRRGCRMAVKLSTNDLLAVKTARI